MLTPYVSAAGDDQAAIAGAANIAALRPRSSGGGGSQYAGRQLDLQEQQFRQSQMEREQDVGFREKSFGLQQQGQDFGQEMAKFGTSYEMSKERLGAEQALYASRMDRQVNEVELEHMRELMGIQAQRRALEQEAMEFADQDVPEVASRFEEKRVEIASRLNEVQAKAMSVGVARAFMQRQFSTGKTVLGPNGEPVAVENSLGSRLYELLKTQDQASDLEFQNRTTSVRQAMDMLRKNLEDELLTKSPRQFDTVADVLLDGFTTETGSKREYQKEDLKLVLDAVSNPQFFDKKAEGYGSQDRVVQDALKRLTNEKEGGVGHLALADMMSRFRKMLIETGAASTAPAVRAPQGSGGADASATNELAGKSSTYYGSLQRGISRLLALDVEGKSLGDFVPMTGARYEAGPDGKMRRVDDKGRDMSMQALVSQTIAKIAMANKGDPEIDKLVDELDPRMKKEVMLILDEALTGRDRFLSEKGLSLEDVKRSEADYEAEKRNLTKETALVPIQKEREIRKLRGQKSRDIYQKASGLRSQEEGAALRRAEKLGTMSKLDEDAQERFLRDSKEEQLRLKGR